METRTAVIWMVARLELAMEIDRDEHGGGDYERLLMLEGIVEQTTNLLTGRRS